MSRAGTVASQRDAQRVKNIYLNAGNSEGAGDGSRGEEKEDVENVVENVYSCTLARTRRARMRSRNKGGKTEPRGWIGRGIQHTNLSLLSTSLRGASSCNGGSADIPWARCFRGRGFVGVNGDLNGNTLRNLSRSLRSSWIKASRRHSAVSSSTIRSSLARSSSCSSLRVLMLATTGRPPMCGTVTCGTVVLAMLLTAVVTAATAATTVVGSCGDEVAAATAASASSSSASRCCVDEKHSESKHTRIDTQASPIGTLYLVPSSIQLASTGTRRGMREERPMRRSGSEVATRPGLRTRTLTVVTIADSRDSRSRRAEDRRPPPPP